MKRAMRENKKIKEDGRPASVTPEKTHNVRGVYPSAGFSSVPSASKRESSMTCTREDGPPVHAGMELNIDGLTGDQVHRSGYSGVGYNASC
jgi:hypothetical protein